MKHAAVRRSVVAASGVDLRASSMRLCAPSVTSRYASRATSPASLRYAGEERSRADPCSSPVKQGRGVTNGRCGKQRHEIANCLAISVRNARGEARAGPP